MEIIPNNVSVFMTRRYPNLKQKVLDRDSKIAKKLIQAWDVEKDPQKLLAIFLKEQRNLSDERYWELLRTVWILSGSLETVPVFRQLMTSQRGQRYYFSTPEEGVKMRQMPAMLTVYRATNNEKDGGISWTLSREYAEWYKQAYSKSTIITRQIMRSKIFAYVERNKEEEIIIL